MKAAFEVALLLPIAMATISKDIINVPIVNSLLNDLVTEQTVGGTTFKCTEFAVQLIESTFGSVVDTPDGQSTSLNVIFTDISASCDNDLSWNTAKLDASIDFFFSDHNTSIPNKIATSESFNCESSDAATFTIDLSLEGLSAEDIEVFRKNVCSAIKDAVSAQIENYNNFPLESFLPGVEPEFEDAVKEAEESIKNIIPDGFDFVSQNDLHNISGHLLCSFGKSELYENLFGQYFPGEILCAPGFPIPGLPGFPIPDLSDVSPIPDLSEIISQLIDELFPSLLPPGVEVNEVYEIFEVDPTAGGYALQAEIVRAFLNVTLGIEDVKFLFTNPLHGDDIKCLKYIVLLYPSTAGILNQVIADESFESVAPLFTYKLQVSQETELTVEVSSFAMKSLNLDDIIVSEDEQFEFFSNSFMMSGLLLQEVIVDVEGKVTINKEGNVIQEELFLVSVAMSGEYKSSIVLVADKDALMDLDLSMLEDVTDAIKILSDAMKHIGFGQSGLEFDVTTSLDNFEFEAAEPFFLDSTKTILEMMIKGIPPYVSKLDTALLSMVDELVILGNSSVPDVDTVKPEDNSGANDSAIESSRIPIYILVGIVGALALIVVVIFAVRRNQVQPNTSGPKFSPEQSDMPTKKEADAINLA